MWELYNITWILCKRFFEIIMVSGEESYEILECSGRGGRKGNPEIKQFNLLSIE